MCAIEGIMGNKIYNVLPIDGDNIMFDNASDFVIGLYNKYSGMGEQPKWKNKSVLKAYLIQDMSGETDLANVPTIGGAVVECIDVEAGSYMVHFLAIQKRYQLQGYGRRLVEIITEALKQEGGELVGAYLNLFDSTDYWEHLGFTHEALINLTTARLRKPAEDAFPNLIQKKELTLEDITSFLGRQR